MEQEIDETVSILATPSSEITVTLSELTFAATQAATSVEEVVQAASSGQAILATESINQASVQNVAGTRQVETAAQDLQNLGQKLKQLLEMHEA